MKLPVLLLAAAALQAPLQAQSPAGTSGQAPAPAAKPAPAPSFAMTLDRQLSGIESEVVPAVEAMPAEAFDFAPTAGEFKGVKTFAQQARHIASVNVLLAAALLEEKPAMDPGGENGPEALKTKAEVVKYLKDSYAYLHKAYGTLTEANILGLVKSPWGEGRGTRLSYAGIGVSHGFDHYGQIAVYLRMNGIVPPASRK